jgi:hypothetical protein
MLTIRWLGFTKEFNLGKSLAHELGASQRKSMKQVAAEPIRCNRKESDLARRVWYVGLMIDETAVLQTFQADVWSDRNARGELVAHAKAQRANPLHGEAFCLPRYTGIVVTMHAMKHRDTMKAVQWAAKTYNVPVYVIKGTSDVWIEEVTL